ncbi:hypothetical protein FSOLCH5_000592 [Fusarium solani]|nr:hypothetical protein NW759_005745 [Fusarium solani]
MLLSFIWNGRGYSSGFASFASIPPMLPPPANRTETVSFPLSLSPQTHLQSSGATFHDGRRNRFRLIQLRRVSLLLAAHTLRLAPVATQKLISPKHAYSRHNNVPRCFSAMPG